MGSTINPQARGGSSLSAELAASRADRGQIRRLFNPAPKPLNPVAAVAGPYGTIRARSRYVAAMQGTTTKNIWGPDEGSWQFYDPSIQGSPGTPPDVYESTHGHLNVSTSGWFTINARFNYGWTSGAPAWVEFHLNPATSSNDSRMVTQVFPVFAGTDGYGHCTMGAAWVPSPADDPANFGSGGPGEVGLLGWEFHFPISAPDPDVLEVQLDITRIA